MPAEKPLPFLVTTMCSSSSIALLAIDLGGIHASLSQTVDLDAQASKLGIGKGKVYSMHIFFAERHPIGSDFVVETTISQFDVCE
jgi:fibro-slime domain-containing protein